MEQKSKPMGRVTFGDGQGNLPMLEVMTEWSEAEIYLHGAHVTHFQKHGEQPLLFLSQCSRFVDNQPIRGGIPLIFPWFGIREGLGMHGFARLKDWELKEFVPAADGSVSVRFRLPDCPEAATIPPFTADYIVTVNQSLTAQLVVTNKSVDLPFKFENCLHTYFEVADVTGISIQGLQGVTYLDRLASYARQVETGEAIRIESEVDRTYVNAPGPVVIRDPGYRRQILIEKSGSASTVVWNPWIGKSQQMPDIGNEEYQRMVCVESGNLGSEGLTLPPGGTSTLTIKLSSNPLS